MWRIINRLYGRRAKRFKGGGLNRTKKRFEAAITGNPNRYDLLGGHIRYSPIPDYPRPIQFITVLRNPTDIILSRRYRRANPDILARKRQQQNREFTQEFPTDPVEYLKSDFKATTKDPLIQVLSGLPGRRRPGGSKRDRIEVTRDHLEQAKSNLREHFGCFGFVERYDETIDLLTHALRWPDRPETPGRHNAGTHRPSKYPDEVYDIGRELSPLDYEFYEYAMGLFEEKLASIQPTELVTP